MKANLGLLRSHAERGIEAAQAAQQADELLAETSAGDLQYSELRLIRAIAWRACGRLHEAEAELGDLEAFCLQSGQTRQLAYIKLEQARLQFGFGNLGQAAQIVRTVLNSGYSSLDPAIGGNAHLLLGRILAMNGETWEAEAELTQALDVFLERADAWRLAEAQSALAMVLVRQGRNFEGIRLWHESLAYHESEGNTAFVTRELERIGYATWCAADLEQTRRTLQRVLQMHEESSTSLPARGLLITHANLAGLELLDGHGSAAAEHIAAALRLAADLDDKLVIAGANLTKAALALVAGRIDEAQHAREAALKAAAAINYAFPVCERPLLALTWAAQGQLDQARSHWPKMPTPTSLDGAQRMSLRTVLKVLAALQEVPVDAATTEQYALWQGELEQLIA